MNVPALLATTYHTADGLSADEVLNAAVKHVAHDCPTQALRMLSFVFFHTTFAVYREEIKRDILSSLWDAIEASYTEQFEEFSVAHLEEMCAFLKADEANTDPETMADLRDNVLANLIQERTDAINLGICTACVKTMCAPNGLITERALEGIAEMLSPTLVG